MAAYEWLRRCRASAVDPTPLPGFIFSLGAGWVAYQKLQLDLLAKLLDSAGGMITEPCCQLMLYFHCLPRLLQPSPMPYDCHTAAARAAKPLRHSLHLSPCAQRTAPTTLRCSAQGSTCIHSNTKPNAYRCAKNKKTFLKPLSIIMCMVQEGCSQGNSTWAE